MMPRDISFSESLKRNIHYKDLKRKVEKGGYNLDTAALMDELERLHKKRKVRYLKASDVLRKQQETLLEANLQDQAYRSRVVSIKMECWRVSSELEQHISTIQKYISTKYGSVLRSQYSTIQDRNNAIETMLAFAIDLNTELNTVITYSDIILNDIDQAAYSLKRNIEVLQLAASRERNL